MPLSRNAFYHVPVVGWLLKDAMHGSADAKYYFAWNVFVLLAAAVYVFGYPLLISMALIATAAALAMLVVLTATDLFDRKSGLAPEAASGRPARHAR